MVKHIDNELKALNDSLEQMWTLVFRQISKSRQALFDCNRSLAREVIAREKMCNALELKIDSQCENFIALNNPVAIDLRLVLAVLKINNNLERIGDFAESVATFVLKDMNGKIDPVLATNLRLEQMFDCIENMFELAHSAFEQEDSKKAEAVFGIDNLVDEINHDALGILAEQIRQEPSRCEEYMSLNHVIRKLERIGDRCNNIAEETVFYLDAKVLKHSASKATEIEQNTQE
ncbi:MAG: phosphate signaling complex protein PhoU [Bacteroidales bacterium]|nr:phosphate signaling complex protein PhoU [Bacteroidales bacterium]